MENMQWGYLDPEDFDELDRIETLAKLKGIVMVAQVAKMGNDSEYRPLTVDLMQMNQKYMGVTWNSNHAPDVNGNHIRSQLKDVSGLDWGSKIINRLSEQGVIYVQSYDVDKVFYPQLRKVGINEGASSQVYFGFAVAEIMHVNYKVWVELTGRSLTDQQLLQQHKARAQYRLSLRLDNRYKVQFDAMASIADKDRGYSWSTEAKVVGRMPKLVKKLTISV